jgi:hypothetical protein
MRGAGLLAAVVACTGAPACAAGLPRPPTAPQPESAFTDVPYPPPAARVETVPAQPAGGGVWVDGQWSWDGSHWDWVPGGWVEPAHGARFAPWALRMQPDGRLRFASAAWRDETGRELPPPVVLAPAEGVDVRALPLRCP